MDIYEAMLSRHAVRKYSGRSLDPAVVSVLEEEIAFCNQKGGLHLQLVTGETDAFGSVMVHYGLFSGVRNYIAMVGGKSAGMEERLGYYGEHLVLTAQMLGLNTCWVGQSYSRRKTRASIRSGERLVCVITVGYGVNQGTPHKSKPMSALCRVDVEMPNWFRKGMEAAMLAPSAMNQQNYFFTLSGGKVKAVPGSGFFAQVNTGIAKYHFSLGAGAENFSWA